MARRYPSGEGSIINPYEDSLIDRIDREGKGQRPKRMKEDRFPELRSSQELYVPPQLSDEEIARRRQERAQQKAKQVETVGHESGSEEPRNLSGFPDIEEDAAFENGKAPFVTGMRARRSKKDSSKAWRKYSSHIRRARDESPRNEIAV